jgi:NTE family protein
LSCTSMMSAQLNPLQHESTPNQPQQILDRVNELTFNASLLTQMRSIDFINTLLAEGALRRDRAKQVLLHRIDGGEAMKEYPASSKGSTDATMIRNLFELGQQRANDWLARHFEAIGERGTVDIRRDYLDGGRAAIAVAQSQPRRLRRAFQPWLARVFRRLRL